MGLLSLTFVCLLLVVYAFVQAYRISVLSERVKRIEIRNTKLAEHLSEIITQDVIVNKTLLAPRKSSFESIPYIPGLVHESYSEQNESSKTSR